MPIRLYLLAVLMGTLASCDQDVNESETPAASSPQAGLAYDNLPSFFDCVRQSRGMLIAAHRGGSGPGWPENAIETMEYGFQNGLRVFEVDVATSQDGVLFLMHDDTLGRTTTAAGRVASMNWAEIANQNLKDTTGRVTRMTPPKLTDALLWARDTGVILELDKKPTTSWRDLISAVRAAEAEDHVVLITYSRGAAGQVHRLAPELMITASADDRDDLRALEREGVDLTRTVGWTGTRRPQAGVWARLDQAGVEAAFGTLGRPGDRLDDVYLRDGNASEYTDMAEDGLVLLATDHALDIAKSIDADDHAISRCGSGT